MQAPLGFLNLILADSLSTSSLPDSDCRQRVRPVYSNGNASVNTRLEAENVDALLYFVLTSAKRYV